MARITIKPKIDMTQINEATEKVMKLQELLKEAKSLMDDLTSQDLEINLSFDI